MKATGGESRYRHLPGTLGIVIKTLLCILCLVAILYVLGVAGLLGLYFYVQQYFGLMFALSLTVGFLIVPGAKASARDKLPWYDALFALISLIVSAYIVFIYPRASFNIGVLMPERIIMGGIMILLGLELSRRLFGWALVAVAIVLLLYARYTYLVPGILGGRGVSWQYLFTFLYLSSGGILGLVANVVFTMVLAFIFFGDVVFHTGGGKVITDFALAALGRFRGGPAKVAVVASSMFGTISGSPVANVLTTGTITIPLMKSIGYRPQVAGAIEAVASTGGLIMPPVMGAAAFVMAELLGISYAEVAIGAVIPAVFFYLGVFIQVDLVAARTGLKGLSREQLPSLRRVVSKGWAFAVPIVVLIYSLFILGIPAAKAAVYSAGAFLVVGAFRKETRAGLRKLLTVFESTGRLVVEMAAIAIIAGVAIGIIGITGVGITFSRALVELAGGNLFLLLLLTAVASMILGMGMNATATYIIVALLTAPALVQLGISELAAHMFVFYFGTMSMITPPICVAVYPASVLAGSPIMRTGFEAVKIGIIAYLAAFLFVLDPSLLLIGSPAEIALAAARGVIAVIFVGFAMQGYLFSPIGMLSRILTGLGAIALATPNSYIVNIIGAGVIAAVASWEWTRRRARRKAALSTD
ncbi:MAG: TRAP transporter fused permease subunit [Chloroflexi bacterium]|nr:TRAP transporter fused permease subunit [Chloroflexota bacterium]